MCVETANYNKGDRDIVKVRFKSLGSNPSVREVYLVYLLALAKKK